MNKGFTLVEVLIAIVIIGIIAAIAIPSYQNYILRANVDRCYKFITPSRMIADNLLQNNNGIAGGAGATLTALGLIGPANTTCGLINVNNLDAVNNGDIDLVATQGGVTMRWRRNGGDSLSPQNCP